MPKTIVTSWAVAAAYPRLGIAGVILLLSAVLVAGCTAPSYGAAAVQPTTAPPVVAAPATAQPATGATPAATSASAAQVKVVQSSQFGQILADDTGRTLYLYTNDIKNTSNCYGGCATAWPPLITGGTPVAGAGADPALIGTTTRRDGQMQVTYNGWPLYYWFKDQKPGDTTGQNVGGTWFVVSPKGDKIAAASTPTSTPSAATY